MPEPVTRAYTEEEQKKRDAEEALNNMIQPMMTEQNRYMSGDGTIGNPVGSAVSEQLAAEKPTEPAQPAEPNAYETEYAAATTPQEKAQVAAKHGDWQKAYGNAQNAIGEVRTRAETLEQQLEAERLRPQRLTATEAEQQHQPQQDPYNAFANFQVVQPRDEYDTEAQRLNEGFRNFAVVLGQGIQQTYGKPLQDIANAVEGLKRMPSNYSVDAQTEARLVNELGIGDLPEWRQKQLVQQFAGRQTRSTTPNRQTPQEAAVQRAVNYVEPSDNTASVQSPQTSQLRMLREYEEARAKETDPLRKNKAGRDVLLKYGVKEVDDSRRLPPM